MGGVPTEGPVETVSLPSGCEPSIPSWVLAAAPVAAPPFFFLKKTGKTELFANSIAWKVLSYALFPSPSQWLTICVSFWFISPVFLLCA